MAIFFVGVSPGCTISTQVHYVNVGASPGCTISTQVHYIFSVQERGTMLLTQRAISCRVLYEFHLFEILDQSNGKSFGQKNF